MKTEILPCSPSGRKMNYPHKPKSLLVHCSAVSPLGGARPGTCRKVGEHGVPIQGTRAIDEGENRRWKMARIMARDLKTKSLKKQRSEPPGWTALRKKTTQRVWLIAARRADARTLGAVCLCPTGTQDPPPASPSHPRRLREMKDSALGGGGAPCPFARLPHVCPPPPRNATYQ